MNLLILVPNSWHVLSDIQVLMAAPLVERDTTPSV